MIIIIIVMDDTLLLLGHEKQIMMNHTLTQKIKFHFPLVLSLLALAAIIFSYSNFSLQKDYFTIGIFDNVRTTKASFMVSSFQMTHHKQYYSQRASLSRNGHCTFQLVNSHVVKSSTRTSSSRLFSSKIPSSNQYKVLLQKVIRPPPQLKIKENPQQQVFFLPSLINYLQSTYSLPQNLPITYEISIPSEDDSKDNTETYSILEIKSPLAAKDDFRFHLLIETIGLYTNSNNDKDKNYTNDLPSMAMVVVKTKASNKNLDTGTVKNDVIRQRLFQDSINKILQSLDAGLDTYASGQVPLIMESHPSDNQNRQKQYYNVDSHGNNDAESWAGIDEYEGLGTNDSWEDIQDLLKSPLGEYNDETTKTYITKTPSWDKNVVIDTVASSSDEVYKTKQTNSKDFAVEEAKKVASIKRRRKNKDLIGDFAVQAAKQAASSKKTKKKTDLIGDFAVDTAKKIATSKSRYNSSKPTDEEDSSNVQAMTSSSRNEVDSKNTSNESLSLQDMLPHVSPMVQKGMGHHYTKSDAFRVSISTPKSFMKRRKTKIHTRSSTDNIRSQSKLNVSTDTTSIDPSKMSNQRRENVLNNLPLQSQLPSNNKPRKSPSNVKTKTREEIEQDIYKAALEIMPGSNVGVDGDSEESGEMTAEELLKDVLKFGEEQEANEIDGAGFVDGAFSKAKELLSLENHQANRDRETDLEFRDQTVSKEERELKEIFAAGQNIAEGRIISSPFTQTQVPKQSNKSQIDVQDKVVTNDYVDELIAADKTVPRNARTLDDELAELEVRISRSPEEALDQGDNALFDIFSGPEIYNPNVDPEVSVNWPGALPGTRTDIKLPPELEQAIKNARYAATILSKVVDDNSSFDLDDISSKTFFIGDQEITIDRIRKLQKCVEEGVAVGLIQDPFEYMQEKSRLAMIIDELRFQPDERFGEIIFNYKDLMLSDNFIVLLREKLQNMVQVERDYMSNGKPMAEIEDLHNRERQILGILVQYAQLLLKETRALGAELEASQLEIIRSICQVAMDPSHETEEETAMALTDAVRDMKPLLDENFVAYLKYAIAEEEGRLARASLLDDPEHNRWLFVLKIVQEGVYAELSRGVQRYIDHISYVLRMETKIERRMLLSQLIDAMPTMDIRPFVKVVDNIAASLGTTTKGEFKESSLGSMANKILQLRRDVHELLPTERINILSKEADEWAARQKAKLMEQRGISKQRLTAARDSNQEVSRRGEVERFD